MFTKRNILHTFAVFFFLVILFFIFKSPAKPWEASGRLVIAVQANPSSLTTDTILGLGIDDVELYTLDGSTKKVTVRTRRVSLDPKLNNTELMLDETIPKGAYSGFGFTLKSPELRNSWEGEEAPTHVSLIGERVVISSPFHIEEDATSALILAFETHEAMHDDAGTKVYLPVIRVETRFNTASVGMENERTSIQGGIIESNATYGMGWDGLMHFNFRAQAREATLPEPLPEEIPPVLEEATSTPETTATSTEDVEQTETASSSSDVTLEETE